MNQETKTAVISWTFGIDDLDELFAKVKDAGFDNLQFCGDYKKYKPEDVKNAAARHEVTIIGYDPMNSKPQSDAAATLEGVVQEYTKVIRFAAAIGAPMVTLQGVSAWMVNEAGYEAAMHFIVQAVQQLCVIARQHSLTATYEACCHYEVPWVQTADELLRIHGESGAGNLQLVLDSFHMSITERDMTEPIRKAGTLLHSYHVSDSGRGGMGTGHINYLSQYDALREAGFGGYVCFELVIAECRPYKLPMNERQMNEFMRQLQYSHELWKAMAKTEAQGI